MIRCKRSELRISFWRIDENFRKTAGHLTIHYIPKFIHRCGLMDVESLISKHFGNPACNFKFFQKFFCSFNTPDMTGPLQPVSPPSGRSTAVPMVSEQLNL